ncbi:hypothetical protein H7R52_18730 [Weissella confusa]|uniref:Uncharacterized protein n=1 Tax=Weissella confusa TaxID=1583 RepID=A0A923NHJ3_WEICO|nr:hypothetical protein [Weissella confusa]
MSVKIVTTNHLQELNRNFVTAGPSLKIVTPFLSFEAIKWKIEKEYLIKHGSQFKVTTVDDLGDNKLVSLKYVK